MWVSKTAYLPVPYLPPACKNIATALQELPGCLRRLDLAANLLSREGLLAAYGPAFLARYADQQASLRAWRPTPHRAELQDHAPQEEEDNSQAHIGCDEEDSEAGQSSDEPEVEIEEDSGENYYPVSF